MHCAQGVASLGVTHTANKKVRVAQYESMNAVQAANRRFSPSSLKLFFLAHLTLHTDTYAFTIYILPRGRFHSTATLLSQNLKPRKLILEALLDLSQILAPMKITHYTVSKRLH